MASKYDFTFREKAWRKKDEISRCKREVLCNEVQNNSDARKVFSEGDLE